MTGTGVLRGRGSRIGTALFLALLTVFSVLSPIPFNQSVARGQTVVTFTVDSADCGEANFCTVYEAITEALGSTDPVTVEVLPGADAGVYGFFQVPEAGFPQGLTVVGIGDDPTITIRSVISDPVVWVRPGNVVTLENLTLEQTSIERVIENNADLTLNGVVVTGGSFPGDGGGIYNSGVLAVQAGSQVVGNTAGLFGPGLVDQENETTSGTTGSGASLLQGFTPTFDTLKRVELEFRADGGYAGSTQTVRIHPVVDGAPDLLSPLGEVQRFVPSTEIAGGASAFIPFEFSPPLNLIPDQQYAIEWGGGSVSWYFSNTAYPPADPYDRGISWSNSGGGLTATPDRDFHFRTYWADIDESGNGGGIFNDGGEVFILNSTVGSNAAVGGEFGENGRGGGVHNAADGELTVEASTISDNTAFQYSNTETGFPNSYGGGVYNNGGIADVINDTTVTGNSANNGGGIYNLYGTLNATDSSISDNTAWNVGGGLVEAAPTTTNLNNVTVSGNSAYEGGGIYVDYGTLNATLTTVSGNTAEYGGGVYNEWGNVTFADGTVNGNTARSGGGIFNDFGTIDLADSTIGPGNLATNGGGGGLNSYGGSLELTNTGVDGNEAYGDGGGVYLSGGWPGYDGTMTMLGGSLSNNQAFEYECEGPCPALGGGLANYYGLTQLTQVAVTGNTVYGYGGGISNGYNATTVISESDVSGNTAFTADSYDPGGSGGGIFSNGTLTIDSTTASGNLADFNGGGVAACDSDVVTIFNSTVSGNTAPTGGGISIDGCFPDYNPESSGTQLNNVTVTDNTAFDTAGGIENISAPLSLSNTIVAGNEVDNDGIFPNDCVSELPVTGERIQPDRGRRMWCDRWRRRQPGWNPHNSARSGPRTAGRQRWPDPHPCFGGREPCN